MKPRGTGTLRRKRWDMLTEGWFECQHRCPEHGPWTHKIPPNMTCKMPVYAACAECLEFPTPYGTLMGRKRIEQKMLRRFVLNLAKKGKPEIGGSNSE